MTWIIKDPAHIPISLNINSLWSKITQSFYLQRTQQLYRLESYLDFLPNYIFQTKYIFLTKYIFRTKYIFLTKIINITKIGQLPKKNHRMYYIISNPFSFLLKSISNHYLYSPVSKSNLKYITALSSTLTDVKRFDRLIP